MAFKFGKTVEDVFKAGEKASKVGLAAGKAEHVESGAAKAAEKTGEAAEKAGAAARKEPSLGTAGEKPHLKKNLDGSVEDISHQKRPTQQQPAHEHEPKAETAPEAPKSNTKGEGGNITIQTNQIPPWKQISLDLLSKHTSAVKKFVKYYAATWIGAAIVGATSGAYDGYTANPKEGKVDLNVVTLGAGWILNTSDPIVAAGAKLMGADFQMPHAGDERNVGTGAAFTIGRKMHGDAYIRAVSEKQNVSSGLRLEAIKFQSDAAKGAQTEASLAQQKAQAAANQAQQEARELEAENRKKRVDTLGEAFREAGDKKTVSGLVESLGGGQPSDPPTATPELKPTSP